MNGLLKLFKPMDNLLKFAIVAYLFDAIMTVKGIGWTNILNKTAPMEGDPVVRALFEIGPFAVVIAAFCWIVLMAYFYKKLDAPYNKLVILAIGVSHFMSALTWIIPAYCNAMWAAASHVFVQFTMIEIYVAVVITIYLVMRGEGRK